MMAEPNQSADAISTHGLTYRYPNGRGVSPLDLRVPRGAIYAFLGANGSGKTTTIRLLLGLLRPQAGSFRLLGRSQAIDGASARRGVGALVEAPSLYPHLTGRQTLEVSRQLLGLPRTRVPETLESVGLVGRDPERKVREYSLGMRQRLGLALALLDKPSLLILDEPGNGLDPAGALQMRALVVRLAQEHAMTVLLSSHLLGEVERMATHIGIIDEGHLRYQGTLQALCGNSPGRLQLSSSDAAATADQLRALGLQHQILSPEDILLEDPLSSVGHPDAHRDAQLLRWLVEHEVAFHAFHRVGRGLESRFFELTSGITTDASP